ncbi:hypothetical protein ACP70R_003843 [Stipagrostis hirtigluma subsp. patula]
MQRRSEFSFPGSPARGLPPRPAASMMATRAVGEEEVRWLQASRQGSPDYGSSDGSGTPSPELWAARPASAGSSPSRAQAIAGYRREMLDLVRGLPESSYELSLRDIVESSPSPPLPLPTPPSPPPSNATGAAAQEAHAPAADAKMDAAADVDDREKQSRSKKQGRKQRTTRKQRSRSLERSVSLDTGLLIKLFTPLSVGRCGKKVSPKPDAAAKDGKKKKEKKKQGTKKEAKEQQDEELWTKSEFSEAGGSSRTSSTGSSNSSAGSIRNGSGNGRAPVRSRSRKENWVLCILKAKHMQKRS